MLIKYNVLMDDLIAFNKFHYEHSASARRSNLIFGVIFPLGIFIWSCIEGLFKGSWSSPIIGGVIGGLLMLWIFGGRRRRFEKAARKILSEGSNKGAVGEHELELAENGLIEKSEYGEARFSWDIVERLGFTPDYTFIYTGSSSGIIIPKAGVIEGDYEELGGTLKRKVEGKTKVEGVEQERNLGKAVITDARKIYKEDTGFGKHSGFGIASFIIAVGVGVLDLLLFGLAFVLGGIVPSVVQRGSTILYVFGAIVMLGFVASLVGSGLGIAGLRQKNRKRVLSILGLIFNCAIVIGFVVLII